MASNLADMAALLPSNPWKAFAVVVGTVVVWHLTTAVYNIFLHPLRRFPGPVLQRASSIPWALQHSRGIQAFRTRELHDEYGPVVRIGPDHLSFVDPRAWRDIYGNSTPAGPDGRLSDMPKAEWFARTVRAVPANILNAEGDEHQRYRRGLARGFSDASMREQEALLLRYIDKLVARFHEACRRGGGTGGDVNSDRKDESKGEAVVNIEAWYNWASFDIAGDLIFGQSFGCLANAAYHPWIAFIFKMARYNAPMVGLKYVGLGLVVEGLFKLGGMVALSTLRDSISRMLESRLALGYERRDLFEGLVSKQKEWNLSFEQLAGNAAVLVLAGSETTSTTLSGATYLLLKHPDALRKVTQEVRSSFKDGSEVNINSVGKLSYMSAVISETLRMYPAVLSGSVRVVPPQGGRIASHQVSPGTMVEVQQWAANHVLENWHDPFVFRPERFLDENKGRDKVDALQAFSPKLGRECSLTRDDVNSLAHVELRLILARILLDFDLEFAEPPQEDWIGKQKAYGIWGRIPLEVRLKPAAA
ncbi:Isotrichodermin C-15 hydroxylase [Colletotrichum higginsianum IMI 349063]|uniref:Isotrichodermin C-15 hydroxylase n=1 Tax=Colletotrichum higginsianum (strain IMI 349063) TaxID=759273 RepID=A0A1B7YBZ6_COLHI|nr:Isotrichodermin C-15 hydroxylase [Colletotrichum higginsianum IMI 349063]OBR09484.1 Isotrichodermin C-15 hydroxylase [Colletotrichum higginsianum IMI 349063]